MESCRRSLFVVFNTRTFVPRCSCTLKVHLQENVPSRRVWDELGPMCSSGGGWGGHIHGRSAGTMLRGRVRQGTAGKDTTKSPLSSQVNTNFKLCKGRLRESNPHQQCQQLAWSWLKGGGCDIFLVSMVGGGLSSYLGMYCGWTHMRNNPEAGVLEPGPCWYHQVTTASLCITFRIVTAGSKLSTAKS